MSELEADLAAIEGLERLINQRLLHRLFPDEDTVEPGGSVFGVAIGSGMDRLYYPWGAGRERGPTG